MWNLVILYIWLFVMDIPLLLHILYHIHIWMYMISEDHVMRRMTKEGYYLNRHSCFLLQYHMVLVTKYRSPVLTGAIRDHVYNTIRMTLEEKDIRIIEMNGEADHIHILFECGPEISPLTLANVLKTRSARFVRRDLHEEVKKFYRSDKPMFWSNSYFVCTVGENSRNIVQNYIRSQDNR